MEDKEEAIRKRAMAADNRISPTEDSEGSGSGNDKPEAINSSRRLRSKSAEKAK